MTLPEPVKARLNEDQRSFTYAERFLDYCHECVQAYELGWAGKKDEARPHFEEAQRIADVLRHDTWPLGMCNVREMAANTLEATRAVGALKRLAELLGPDEKANSRDGIRIFPEKERVAMLKA